MSYIYLQEQGEASSADCFSDISPFVLSRLNHTAEKSFCNDNGTESCRGFQSGTMYAPSTASRGEELQMLSAVDSHVKTSVVLEQEQDLTENGLDCGEKWRGSFAKYNRDLSLWKIHQCSLFGDSDEFSETWPRWGSMHDGECFLLPTLEHCTSVNAFGYLPTPRKSGQSRAFKAYKRKDYKGNLEEFIGLNGYEGWMNPRFSELVMMWPVGWTDISPLETDKFQKWQKQHG